MSQDFFSVEEVAKQLNCSARSIRNLVNSGKLRAIQIGSGERSPYRIHRTFLEEFIQEQSEKRRQVEAGRSNPRRGPTPRWQRADFE